MSVVVELKKLLSFTQKKLNEIISKEEAIPEFHREMEEALEAKAEAGVKEAEGAVSVAVEAAEEPKPTKPVGRKGRNGELNRSQTIREYLADHAGASNKEVVEHLKNKYGVEVSPEYVSTVKFQMKERKGTGRAKGLNKSKAIREYLEKDPDASAKDVLSHLKEKYGTSATTALIYGIMRSSGKKGRRKVSVNKESKRGDPMRACVTEVLSKFRQGVKLNEVAKTIKKSGKYHYAGKKGDKGFMLTVYQALYDLSQKKTHPGWKGEVAVVLHDKERRRWKLNPKAKREMAA